MLSHYMKWIRTSVVCALISMVWGSASAVTWPTDAQWQPVMKDGAYLQDPNSDATGSRNVVSDATHAAVFFYNDLTYMFFRMRLDADPTGSGGQGALQSFGWGVIIDTDGNLGDYEWMVLIDGIASGAANERVSLRENTTKTNIGDPEDVAEVERAAYEPIGTYMRIVAADTRFKKVRFAHSL